MKAYLNIELEITDYEKTLADAREWEELEKYKYSNDEEALIVDFILCHDGYYNLEDSDLYIVTAKENNYPAPVEVIPTKF